MAPKFSIITVTYNAQDSIVPTLESIFLQTQASYESIVIDGASTDQTLERIGPFKKRIAHLVSEPDQGLYDAMNKAFHLAKGEYLLFLNAGDRFIDANVLTTIEQHLQPNTRILSADFINVQKEGSTKGKHIHTKPCTLQELKKDFAACHQTVFVHRSVAAPYDLNYELLADYKWVTMAARQCQPSQVVHVPVPIVYYLDGGKSATQTTKNFKERFRLHRELFGPLQMLKNTPNYLRRALRELKRMAS